MRWLLGLLVAWLALDALVIQRRDSRPLQPRRNVARLAAADWPQLPPRTDWGKSSRRYGSLRNVRFAHNVR